MENKNSTSSEQLQHEVEKWQPQRKNRYVTHICMSNHSPSLVQVPKQKWRGYKLLGIENSILFLFYLM